MRLLKSIAAAFLVLVGFAGESRAATLLASFERGSATILFPNSLGAGIMFEIGYESSTVGVFDGPVFASSNFPFPRVSEERITDSGAGFDALKLRIADGVDDTILVMITILLAPRVRDGPNSRIITQTFLESAWISGGDTGLPGPSLTGFVLSELVANNPFTIGSSGSTAIVTYGLDYKLFGTPSVTPVPLPASLPLFAGALGLFGLVGWRRKRKVAA